MSPLLALVFLGVAAAPATATAASAEIFPGLRKRRQAAVKALVQVPEKTQDQIPPQVPAAVPSVSDAGEDGFPKLPAVSQMLNQASDTLKSVSSQASGLEARVTQAQMQSEMKMAKQKAAFESKLKAQENGNQKVISANGNITAEIKHLEGSNDASKKQARDIEKSNHVMRSQLRSIESHLGTAKDFIAKSLIKTDDSKNALLQVLRKGASHHHTFVEVSSSSKRDSDDDSDDDDEEDSAGSSEESSGSSDDDEDDDTESGTSLLSISMTSHRSTPADMVAAAVSEADTVVPAGPSLEVAAAAPGDLLEVLVKDVAHLAEQEKESEKNLKQLFVRDFRAGVKRNMALLAQQKTLIAKRNSLLTLQAELKKAEAHVDSTRAQLENSLHGLGQYLQKLSHFAMAPQGEVKHLLEVLPKAVTVKH